MRWTIFCIFILFHYLTNAELNVPELLANEKNIGDAGTRARISRKGINYVATVLTQNLIPEIINARMSEEPSQMEIETETVQISELSMTVAEHKALVQTDLLPPNLILINIPGINVTSNLQVIGNSTGESLDAVVSIRSENTLVKLSVNPMRTSTGAPNLRIQECNVQTVKPIQLRFDGKQMTDKQKSLIQPALEAEAGNLLNDLICNRIIFIVEERVNDRFGLLSPKIALKHTSDDEIVRDLSSRLRSRRQRREETEAEFEMTAEDFHFGDTARLLRAKRQWSSLDVPFVSMGAGFRGKRFADEALVSEDAGRLEDMSRRRFKRQYAGINVPVVGELGAGFRGKRSTGMPWDMGSAMRMPMGMNVGGGRRKRQWGGMAGAGMNVPVVGMMGAGVGRRRRSIDTLRVKRQWGMVGAGMNVPVVGMMGAGVGKRRKRDAMRTKRQWSMLGAGMNVPVVGNMGANVGRRKRETLIAGFNVSRANNLNLDYTIISDMNVTTFGLEIESSGETSIHGRGGTPFGPVKVTLPQSVNEDYMLQMIVSDYMPNSLMYHGHTIGLFNTRVDPTTSHLGGIMRTTCSLSSGVLFCLGDLFPTLKKLHPNRRLALNFNTIQSPVIRFHTLANGGITFNLLGRIVFLVIEPETRQEKQVAEMSIEVHAHMKLRLSSSMVRPKITLEKIKLATLSPGILLQNELDDAVMLSREVLQRMVNDILRDGIPIPVHPLFKLIKPKVKIMDRALLLQTNFELNKSLVKQITTGDFRKRA